MTVADLLELLKSQDPDARVVVHAHESRLDDLLEARAIAVDRFHHAADEWWQGDLEAVSDGGDPAVALLSKRGLCAP
jgi:hypothetical protein